jgi:hypothetical protein
MFLTFVAPDRVVVAQCDPAADAENARILDRTAEALSHVRTRTGPMQVYRVPMPPAKDGVWRSYTNVIFANGVLMVPTYSGVDPAVQARALAVYRKLLPGWKVVGINADAPASQGGSLHCVSLNVPGYVPVLPLLQRGRTPLRDEAADSRPGTARPAPPPEPDARTSRRPPPKSPSPSEDWMPTEPVHWRDAVPPRVRHR